jgi:hypothetical protein
MSAFLLLCLTALVWAELRPPQTVRGVRVRETVSAPVGEAATPEVPWELGIAEELPVVEEAAVSLVKPPASPPVPEAVVQPSDPPDLGLFASGPGLPPTEQPVVPRASAGENHGTALAFARSPAEAARQALVEHKLLFTIHLSGNFEDEGLT